MARVLALSRVKPSAAMNSLTSSPTPGPLARLTMQRNGLSVTPDMGDRNRFVRVY